MEEEAQTVPGVRQGLMNQIIQSVLYALEALFLMLVLLALALPVAQVSIIIVINCLTLLILLIDRSISASECMSCDANTIADPILPYCMLCGVGFYSLPNSSSCSLCPSGTFDFYFDCYFYKIGYYY